MLEVGSIDGHCGRMTQTTTLKATSRRQFRYRWLPAPLHLHSLRGSTGGGMSLPRHTLPDSHRNNEYLYFAVHGSTIKP